MLPWSPDPAFPVHIDFGATTDVAAHAIALQADGRILVAGRSGGAMAVARLWPDGSLDASFDGDGKALFESAAGVDAQAVWVKESADGHILVIGEESGQGNRGIVVLRLSADGSPDAAFGTDGRQRLPPGVQGSCAPVPVCDAALLADGALLVPSTRINNGAGAVSVFKFRPDGAPDADFGDDGIVTLAAFPSTGNALAQAVGLEVLPDGRLLVAVSNVAGAYRLALVRLDADGAVDPAFAGTDDDIASVEPGYGVTVASMQLDAQGRPVLALVLPPLGPGPTKFGALRFDTDGAPDAGFGVDGFATLVPSPDCTDGCLSLGMQFDAAGRIFLVGSMPAPDGDGTDNSDVALARLTPDGAIDTSFAPDGVRNYGTQDPDAGTRYQEYALALALDSDGRALIAGVRSDGDAAAMQVWRVRSEFLMRDGFE